LSFSVNATAPPELYTLSLHDALPIFHIASRQAQTFCDSISTRFWHGLAAKIANDFSLSCCYHALVLAWWLQPQGEHDVGLQTRRSEEHTSELQSLRHLVCRLLLEKKK